MKKIVFILVVLLLAAPAWAEVLITCTQGSSMYFPGVPWDGNEVTVSYNFTSEANNVRAFSFDITLEDTSGADDAVIVSISDVNPAYNIHPGSITIVDGEVTDYGSAVCSPSYPDTLDGLGTNGMTIEMASLYQKGDPAPAKSGVLFKMKINNKACTIHFDENGRRGGVVMENPDEVVDVNAPGSGGFPFNNPMDVCGFIYGAPDNIVDSWDFNLLTSTTPGIPGNNWLQTPPEDPRADITGFLYGAPDGTCDSWDYNYVCSRLNIGGTFADDWN